MYEGKEKFFPIFHHDFAINKERDAYNHYRQQFHAIAETLTEEFQKMYRNNYHSIEDVHRDCFDKGNETIAIGIDEAINIIISYGIYDIDFENFISNYYSKYYDWPDVFDEVDMQYLKIVYDAEQLDEYRTQRRQNRGRWVGGGFGLEGAMKGALTAGAMNMTTGALHGLANIGGKLISSAIDNSEKRKLFRDPNTLLTLSNGIYDNICNIHLAIHDVLIDYNKGSLWSPVYTKEAEKAKNLLSNIDRIPDIETRKTLLLEALTLNPYNFSIFQFIIEHDLDSEDSIVELANYFGFNLDTVVEEKLAAIFESENPQTEQKALSIKSIVLKTMKKYHMEESETLTAIEELLSDFDLKARTFKSYVFDTREECKKAKAQDAELTKIINQNLNLEYLDLKGLKEQLCNSGYHDALLEEHLVPLNDKLIAYETNSLSLLCKNLQDLSLDETVALYNHILILDYDKTVKEKYLEEIDVHKDDLILAEMCKGYESKPLKELVDLSAQIDAMEDMYEEVVDAWLDKINTQIVELRKTYYRPYVEKLIKQMNQYVIDERLTYYIDDKFEKKINGALNSYVTLDDDEIPLLLVDNTAFSNGQAGITITNKHIYYKDFFTKGRIPYKELKSFVGIKKLFTSYFNIADNKNTYEIQSLVNGRFIQMEATLLKLFMNAIADDNKNYYIETVSTTPSTPPKQQTETSPGPMEAPVKSTIYCTNCGKKLLSTVKFCSNCGTKINRTL